MFSKAAAARRMAQKGPEPVVIPAPMGSINTVAGAATMPPEDCIFRYNAIPAEYGLRSRLGSREWVTGLDGEVRALLPFTGSTAASNKLFACTATGIWDVTSSTTTPTQVVTFASSDSLSGFASSVVMVNSAGHFLVVCDETNGMYTYTESGATWLKVAAGAGGTDINGADPASFAHVCGWKNRLWFTQKDTGTVWYTAVNALYGAVAAKYLGARFAKGGTLVGVFNWTGDGGAGIDDHLVAISTGGDILVYAGTDPATAGAFNLVGVYYGGSIPSGRKIATEHGGDLLILTSTGIFPMSKLTAGAVVALNQTLYDTSKITNLFNQLNATTGSALGWQMVIHPVDATLIVIVPTTSTQMWLAMSLATRGWSVYRDLPSSKAAVQWSGTMYFGTDDGRVMINDGYLDGVTLADPDSYTPIQCSLLTKFDRLGTPRQKRVNWVRPTFLSQSGAVPYDVQARYRFDLNEIGSAPASATTVGTALWDVALWDQGLWAPDYFPDQRFVGVTGIGPEVAFAIRWSSAARTVLVDMVADFDVGGLM